MSREEAGRVVVVTGASAGIGRETALVLARRGWRVFGAIRDVQGRNAEKVAELRRAADGEGLALEVVEIDVDRDDSVQRGVQAVLEGAGRINALVNNAAFGVLGPWETTSVEAAKRQFETNLFGVFRMSKAAVPAMRAQGGGTILNVGSDSGIRVLLLESFYAASKFALEGMSQGMRWELRQFGIRVCVVNPGWHRTSFGGSATWSLDPEHPSGPYQALVEHLSEVGPRKLAPRDDLSEVTEAIADLLDMDDPPLRTTATAMPLLVDDMTLDEYERQVFDFYELDSFRGPGA